MKTKHLRCLGLLLLICIAPLSSQAQVTAQLLAHFTCDGTADDATGNSPPLYLRNTSFIDNTLYLNGIYGGSHSNGFSAFAFITGFKYESFTVALDFSAAGYTNDNILTGGSSYRWFSLRHNAGRLEVTLNNQALVYLLPTSRLKTNEWQSVICSVDAAAKRIIVALNGQRFTDIVLSPTFRFDVVGTSSEDSDKLFTFANYSNGSAFHGFADNLKVWNRALAASEIDALIAPPVLSPTVQMCIQRVTNPLVAVSWGPTQAVLQCSAGVTGIYTNVPGAKAPFYVDTRVAPRQFYRAYLQVSAPTLFMWNDSCSQPARLALDWAPREWRLQQTRDFSQWEDTPSTPVTGWYYPAVPLEVPPAPRGAEAGMRAFRTVPPAATGSLFGGPVYSVNIVAIGYANFQVGRSNLFSYPFANFDRRLDTLLPLPAEAAGTLVFFYDSGTQTWGLPNEFAPDLGGWVDGFLEPALWPANQSACLLVPRSSTPGATAITTLLAGEVAQGTFQRTLPMGMTLNGPLVPARGGITTTHRLFPNDGDQVFLFNASTQSFETYDFVFGAGWIPSEPVIGAMDGFFYVNNNGPLNWTITFHGGP